MSDNQAEDQQNTWLHDLVTETDSFRSSLDDDYIRKVSAAYKKAGGKKKATLQTIFTWVEGQARIAGIEAVTVERIQSEQDTLLGRKHQKRPKKENEGICVYCGKWTELTAL